MSDALGSNGFVGVAPSDAIGIHRDPTKWGDATEISIKADEEKIKLPLLRPNVYQNAAQEIPGKRSVAGGFKVPFHPSDWVFLLKYLLGTVTSVQQGGTAAYKHSFLGANTLPANGLSISKMLDKMAMHMFGCFANTLTLAFEVGQAVMATWELVGKDAVEGVGTAGTSTGASAISFPVTLVVSTSDDLKLAVDGGSAIELNIAAAIYANGTTLAAAINAAIAANASLIDINRNPKVGCYVNSASKLVFYSATKGAASSVAWTAGTHDASTLLGKGTESVAQVESLTGARSGSQGDLEAHVHINSTEILWDYASSQHAIEYEELLGQINATAEPVTATYINPSAHEDGIYVTADVAGVSFTMSIESDPLLGTLAVANVTPNTTGTNVEAAGSATMASPTYSALIPFIYHQGIIKVDGTEVEVDKITLTISNNLAKKDVLGRNSMVGVNISQRTVTGSFTKWLENNAIRTKFRNGTDAELKIELRTGVEAATGYNYDCDIWMKKIRYGNPEPTVSSNDPIREEVPFTSYYYDATYQDILIDVTNLETSY